MRNMKFSTDKKYAKSLDLKDPLKDFKKQFLIPGKGKNSQIYFCGNSLGLQPVTAKKYIEIELNDWAELAVEGHFKGTNPWADYHKLFRKPLAALCGALPEEVVAMNSLTANLHLLLVSFYWPRERRVKILAEAGSFSSDIYALTSQIEIRGFDPAECLVEVGPREGEFAIRDEDIISKIEELGDELALVMMSGVNYYTGQAFDMEAIAEAAHNAGAYVGFDLAHAIGNIPLNLHEWQVDFATWCSYKYLNAGPGGTAGLFVHSENFHLPRFAGWWGNDEKERFLMKPEYEPSIGAEGWQLSNAPVLSMAVLKASLDIFQKAGLKKIFKKSEQLTAYLEYLIKIKCTQAQKEKPYKIRIITPTEPSRRGAQLSIYFEKGDGKKLVQQFAKEGIILDWRSPNVLRVSPAPLYNSYTEVYTFVERFAEFCEYVN